MAAADSTDAQSNYTILIVETKSQSNYFPNITQLKYQEVCFTLFSS